MLHKQYHILWWIILVFRSTLLNSLCDTFAHYHPRLEIFGNHVGIGRWDCLSLFSSLTQLSFFKWGITTLTTLPSSSSFSFLLSLIPPNSFRLVFRDDDLGQWLYIPPSHCHLKLQSLSSSLFQFFGGSILTTLITVFRDDDADNGSISLFTIVTKSWSLSIRVYSSSHADRSSTH